MPSAKQSRRRRQATAPPPPVRAKGAARQASPRVLLAAAGAVAVVVVAVVLAVVLTRGGSSSSASATKLSGAVDVTKLLNGIPQHGNVLGGPSAPVTMVEYVDLQCPFCQEFETTALPTIVRRYVRTGKLKIVARPIAFIGSDSVRGRDATLAAGRQNKLFDFAQLLYLNQGAENSGWLSDNVVKSAAASIPGLSVSKLLADRGSSAVSDDGHAIDADASADGVHATPTILVGRSGSTPKEVALASPSDAQSVERAIDAALG